MGGGEGQREAVFQSPLPSVCGYTPLEGSNLNSLGSGLDAGISERWA